ncbi:MULTISPECIES: EAL and HDOD domain-containing protein [unclassified Oleiphilus]|uniref:EAL and HDOD domain-containing protein n=3 Tax=Oleiphilus TaxID=141450 RepID=UPI0007C27404|nr:MULTISPECIES: HDOD domain-containing protein [unclassified Oleiphilus]KZY50501.1 diguanylate phosphodiesterase [Oleiphilus sp. HI0050]KZZ35427.1 diguanylate phosphodiesterase [Oleiphilus sp. HI0117]KZZ36954.1 diguanylate phosphodiesterase [Oleiphilus sp. HI0086]KZZ52351.1 diguanylate phosphodiesterase [Oleiphilus sp. HI0123]
MTDKNDVLLARQPIYDRSKTVTGYELLFRSECDTPISSFDGNLATSRVLLNLFTESDISSITNNLPAYVNFTAELLHNPPLFNPDTVVIEVLENIEITDKVVSSLKKLKQRGFTLALDDFIMDERYQRILPLVDIIKLELPEMDDDELQATIKNLKQHDVTLLAEKIETPEQFKRCHELGCDLFQGYFLSKPEIIKGKKIAAGKMAIINLISEIQAPEIDMDGLTSIISRDPALSFKLLKLINSAAFKRSNTIDSIHKAVTLLGIDKIKSWASLLALSKLDDKPEALHYMALVRALMCERLSEYIEPSLKDQFYTVGLLSCLDAFFDQSLSDIVSHISLAPGINDALTLLKGNAGLALSTTIAFEQSEWQKLDWTALAKFELNAKQINEIYFESSRKALEISAEN